MKLESCASHGGVLRTARFPEYFWVKFVIEAEKYEPPRQQIYLVSIILWVVCLILKSRAVLAQATPEFQDLHAKSLRVGPLQSFGCPFQGRKGRVQHVSFCIKNRRGRLRNVVGHAASFF